MSRVLNIHQLTSSSLSLDPCISSTCFLEEKNSKIMCIIPPDSAWHGGGGGGGGHSTALNLVF